MKITGNTILITGGGSGIGQALAYRFHDLGNKVIIAGRRQDTLELACTGRENMHAMTVDVDDNEDILRFAKCLIAQHPNLNILMNNAGIMRTEVLDHERELSDAEAMIATNLLGTIRMTNALINHLMSQSDGAIVNVSSGLAFVPRFSAPTYNATKAAIHSYTVSLREALKGSVEVIELIPPAVQTALTPGQQSRAGYQPLQEFADEVMTLFAQQPTPAEILVSRVGFQRFAEMEGRYDTALNTLNQMARKALVDQSSFI